MPESKSVRSFTGFVRNLTLRTRLILSMIFLAALAVTIMSIFNYSRTQQMRSILGDTLNLTVRQQAQQGLEDRVAIESSNVNEVFEVVAENVNSETQYVQQLLAKEELFGAGNYWDARQKLSPLDAGQLDNPNSDLSSLVVPTRTRLDDATVAEINTIIYLDFLAPEVLRNNPELISTSYVGSNGVTIYYPNINLAKVVGNFDATTQPYYQIATPENNPKRLSVWTVPYQDPALAGLIVTNSMPVYDAKDKFRGVISANLQLAQLAERVKTIRAGSTGYGFLIDSAGRILAMPEKGYSDLGLTRESVAAGESLKNTILDQGSAAFQGITKRMTAGESGLAAIDIHDSEHFIAYTPLASVNYSLGIIVPTSELTGTFAATQVEIENQSAQTINYALIIFGIVISFTILVSWGLGYALITPFTALTKVAQQITAGDLTRRAEIKSNDEAGLLGQAFNVMADEVTLLVQNLETSIEERTAELQQKTNEMATLSERQKHRAEGLQAVAEVSRAITSVQDVDELLPRITRVVSEQFSFYHVGIFLVDPERRYARLSATNSQGGKRMLERGHQLKIGEVGLVGAVAATGRPNIALDTGADAIFFNNPDLPETRSEIALPLVIADEVIGVLDVQSNQPNAFSGEDIELLTILANQVSVAIRNARQFQQTRKALLEAETIYRQYVQKEWKSLAADRKSAGYEFTTSGLKTLGKEEALALRPNGKSSVTRQVSIPVKLRGQIIGYLTVTANRDAELQKDEIDIAQATADRVALAIENARLLESSQDQAARERTLGEITSKIGSSVNLRNVLQTAVEELGRVLPGSDVVIQLESNRKKE
jgi:GAF domain-containing protein/HAMP domain-containing protein